MRAGRPRTRTDEVIRAQRAAASKRWRERHPAKHASLKRTANRKAMYGIVDTELFAAQGGRCAACQTPITISDPVDHDHETGRTRGMVCKACNLALGHAKEDPLRLRALADYIERWRRHG